MNDKNLSKLLRYGLIVVVLFLILMPGTAVSQSVLPVFKNGQQPAINATNLNLVVDAIRSDNYVTVLTDGSYVIAKNNRGVNISTGTRGIDDSTVIQAAIDACPSTGGVMRIIGGPYVVTTPLDFTDVPSFKFRLDMTGATLIGRTTGLPMMDFTGVWGVCINDGYIIGDPAHMPSTAMLFARKSLTGAGQHRITKTYITGAWSDCNVYNYCSEENVYSEVVFENNQTGSYIIEICEDNVEGITSPYTTTGQYTMGGVTVTGSRLCNVGQAPGGAVLIEGDARDIQFKDSYLHANGTAKIVFSNPGELMNGPYDFDNIFAEGITNYGIYIDCSGIFYPNFNGMNFMYDAGEFIYSNASIYNMNCISPYIGQGIKNITCAPGYSIINSNIVGGSGSITGVNAYAVYSSEILIPNPNNITVQTATYGSIIRTAGAVNGQFILGGNTFLTLPKGNYVFSTISNGTITPVQSYQIVRNENSDSSDDLLNITPTHFGDVLILTIRNDTAQTIVRNMLGNIKLTNAFPYTMKYDDTLTLYCDGTNWIEIARSQKRNTDRYGTATILTGESSVVVAHGLTSASFYVFCEGSSQETATSWVTAQNTTSFTINIPAATSANRTIFWHAMII